jgi:hypothetical protein
MIKRLGLLAVVIAGAFAPQVSHAQSVGYLYSDPIIAPNSNSFRTGMGMNLRFLQPLPPFLRMAPVSPWVLYASAFSYYIYCTDDNPAKDKCDPQQTWLNVSTDSAGNITNWDIQIVYNNPGHYSATIKSSCCAYGEDQVSVTDLDKKQSAQGYLQLPGGARFAKDFPPTQRQARHRMKHRLSIKP